mgnify:CR=1 FL=1
MAQSYFVWKDTDSRNMGIIMRQAAPIIRPEERVQHVTIPGMSGDLTEIEGENIYNSYIQTVEISVKSAARVPAVYKWLRGSGYVTFSGEPDRRQPARIIGAITLNKHSYNLDWWEGEVQFYCQPLKELLEEAVLTITAAGTVQNLGDVASRPRILATASGTEMTITVNSQVLTITGLTSGKSYIIDSEIMDVLNADETEVLTALSEGDFPVLEQGDNIIGGSGWSSLRIERRERYL